MSEISAQHQALLATLHAHQVRFVLIGAVTLQLHGFTGATRDVDVLIATDAANTRRLDAALVALRARPYLAGERGSAYHTELGQIEILRFTHPREDYATWERDATTTTIAPGLDIRVGNPLRLVQAKERAARPKDTVALPRIRAELLANGALQPADIHGPIDEPPTPITTDPAVEQLLGPRPATTRQRDLWDRAAQLIGEYRERWKLTAEQPSLGATPPAHSHQAQDLQALQRQIGRLQRLIDQGRELDIEL